MAEVECTAIVADGESRPNPLFTPPCTCPRCAPTLTFDVDAERESGWLRIGGDVQRRRVTRVDLGSAASHALG